MTTGLGVYELYVNGRRVGTDFLKPGFTDGRKSAFRGVLERPRLWDVDTPNLYTAHVEVVRGGAAVDAAAIRRQIRILKDMGANAIRTAHNPPAPELLRLCDEMGMLVLDEAFDVWTQGKIRHFAGSCRSSCAERCDLLRRTASCLCMASCRPRHEILVLRRLLRCKFDDICGCLSPI